jgi:uncharacterized OB-fold protein
MLEKPAPHPNADSAPYWEACTQGRLVYQYCERCERAQFYPRSICVHCGADRPAWRDSSRRGTVYALTELHAAGLLAFRAEAPFAIALIEMEEGFRIMTNIIGPPLGAVAIGDGGTIVFERRGAMALPQFQPDMHGSGTI